MSTLLAIVALVVAMSLAVVSNGRHRRVRKRLARLERRNKEALGLIKAVAARALTDRTSPPVLRSEWGEDLVALELFGWKHEGYYIEVGAYDGRRFSVTAALDELGWRGLLVEPVPELC
ncbi:MAG: hypothetical protein H6810_01285 [Phycisphaeraceae bacterium]|nr:MAG: hypothetical protein H6810_01285 [Phycisphaeraceae bacterium]